MNDEPLPNSDEIPEPLDLTPARLSALDRKILEYFPGPIRSPVWVNPQCEDEENLSIHQMVDKVVELGKFVPE